MESLFIGGLLFCMALLLLKKALGTVAYPLSSLVVRRRLKALHSAPALRELSSAERGVLRIFLDSQTSRLVDTQVRSLGGAHTTLFHPFGGGVLRRELIDGVELKLPYVSELFLVPDGNAAEVVLTPEYAIAVKLNGFDLVAAHEEAQRPPAQDSRQQGGSPRVLPDCSAEDLLRYQRGEVDLLGERWEPPEEVRMRMPQRFGTLDQVVMASGIFCVLSVWSSAFAGRWFATAFIPIVLLAWFGVRALLRRELNAPRKILRYRGRWNQIALADGDNAERHHYLGDSIKLTLPKSWLAGAARLPAGQVLDIEVRASDNQVLGMGKQWSLQEQHKRFPLTHAARSLFLLFVGLLALFSASRQMDDLAATLAMAGSWLTQSERRAESPAALVEHSPAFGQLLGLQGRARCELVSGERLPDSLALPTVDCRRLRWGGTLATPSLQLSPAVLHLFHGDFIQAKKDTFLNVRLRSLAGTDTLYPESRFPLVIQNLPEAIRMLDEVCQPANDRCEDLRQQLAANVIGLEEGPASSWEALLAMMQRADQWFVVKPLPLTRIRGMARDLVALQVEAEIARLSDQILSSQQAGVLLISDAPFPRPLSHDESPPQIGAQQVGAQVGAQGMNLSEYWKFLEAYAHPESLEAFDFLRSTVDVERSGEGLVIRVGPPFSREAGWNAFVLILWLLLALLLTVRSGIQFIVRFPLAVRRHVQRIDFQQQVAGQAGPSLLSGKDSPAATS